MRRKTRAPSLFAKTAFDPTFIDSLAIDERGGGEGKLESEIQLSKTIFFFFLALCSSFFFLLRHNHNSILVRSSTLDNFLPRERFTD